MSNFVQVRFGQPLFLTLLSLAHTANGWMQRRQGHANGLTLLHQADTFLKQHNNVGEQSSGCTFQVAAHVNAPGLAASPEGFMDANQQNVIWQRKEVMVVESRLGSLQQRYLVFNLPDGSCHEQAEQACTPATDSRRPTNSSNGAFVQEGRCSPCLVSAGAAPPLTYIRSMLGGALSALANIKPLPSADRFLAIGLGSGALPLWAAQNFPGVTVEAVDLSPDVVAAAPCFGIQNDTLVLHVGDGRTFLAQQAEGIYDAIFIDAFDDRRTIPQCLSTFEFFEMVEKKLKPEGGVMALNVAGGSNVQDLVAAVQATFMHVVVGVAQGETNHVIVASQMELDASGNPSKSSDADASQTSDPAGSHLDAEAIHHLAQWARESEFVAADRVSSMVLHDADILGGCST